VVDGDVCLLDSISELKAQGLALTIRSLLQIDLGYSRKLWNQNGHEPGFRKDFPLRKPLVKKMVRGNSRLILGDLDPVLPWVPLLQIHEFERPDEIQALKMAAGPSCLTTKDWLSG